MPWGSLRPWGSLAPWGSLGGASAPAHRPRTLREAVWHRLTTDGPLKALVGQRAYPSILPRGCPTPAVSFAVGSRADYRDYDGTNLAATRVRLSAWSEDPDAADSLVAALRRAFVDFAGFIGDFEVHDVEAVDEIDLSLPPGRGDDEPAHRIILDVRVWHNP